MDAYSTDLESIKRRQAIADALATGSLAPIQGGNAGALGILAKIGQAYFSKKASDNLEGEKKEVQAKYMNELRSGMDQFYKTSDGYEAPILAMNPDAEGNSPMRKVPGDSRKAIMDAMASGHPV